MILACVTQGQQKRGKRERNPQQCRRETTEHSSDAFVSYLSVRVRSVRVLVYVLGFGCGCGCMVCVRVCVCVCVCVLCCVVLCTCVCVRVVYVSVSKYLAHTYVCESARCVCKIFKA